jgi:hypothetical protein
MAARIHGLSRTRLFNVWYGMVRRCHESTAHDYPHYGGRGIVVCPEWKNDFMAFRSWALSDGYADHLTIDRKDNDGNYEPGNCHWITNIEQQRHRRNNHTLTLNGETLPISVWAVRLGVERSTLWRRHSKYGKSDEETLSVERLRPAKLLTMEQCAEIRRRREAGEVLKSLARDFDCSHATISDAARGVRGYTKVS